MDFVCAGPYDVVGCMMSVGVFPRVTCCLGIPMCSCVRGVPLCCCSGRRFIAILLFWLGHCGSI